MTPTVAPWAFVLAVPNIDVSAAYFRDVLGFKISWDDSTDWRLVERNNVRVMLGSCPTDLPALEIGSHSWFGYIEVSDLTSFHGEIIARGAVCSLPADRTYGMREIVVTTIDGHRIVFGQETGRQNSN